MRPAGTGRRPLRCQRLTFQTQTKITPDLSRRATCPSLSPRKCSNVFFHTRFYSYFALSYFVPRSSFKSTPNFQARRPLECGRRTTRVETGACPPTARVVFFSPTSLPSFFALLSVCCKHFTDEGTQYPLPLAGCERNTKWPSRHCMQIVSVQHQDPPRAFQKCESVERFVNYCVYPTYSGVCALEAG